MTIGEKIMLLRTGARLSQEQLGEALEVSRQSVSKWELGEAMPQLEKLLPLCQLFGVTADALLRPETELPVKEAQPVPRGALRYFGTDGFRGEANTVVSPEKAYRIGRYLGWYCGQTGNTRYSELHRAKIVIGKDTRRSSYVLEYAISAGMAASGADVYMLHVTTTPSVSYVTRHEDFDCGVMISASHNPFSDNGIKLLNAYGEKLDDSALHAIEAYMDGDLAALGLQEDIPLASGEAVGRIVDHVAGRNRYIGYLISIAAHSYKNMKIGLDCANGAAWMIAQSVFSALGASLTVIGAQPDGTNINRDCGSTHIEALQRVVREQHLDVGFAFDGDADRCIAVDGSGNEVSGDHILYLLAKRLKSCGALDHNTVVLTVMSNSGMCRALEAEGIRYVRTAVGDRYVYECMQEHGYRLGGEQSGHIILQKYATTGDGILTALMVMEELMDRKFSLEKMLQPVRLFPQVQKSLRVTSKAAVMADAAIQEKAKAITAQIGGRGRLLLRESGTEPVIRIMAEYEDGVQCRCFVEEMAAAIREGGYAL